MERLLAITARNGSGSGSLRPVHLGERCCEFVRLPLGSGPVCGDPSDRLSLRPFSHHSIWYEPVLGSEGRTEWPARVRRDGRTGI